MTDKIEKMTDDDFKKIMKSLGMPDSMSLYSALKQVENHTWQAARTVPEGFVVVPVEPTLEMQAAGAQSIRFDTTTINKLWTGNKVYRAMLSAAPEEDTSHD